MGDYSAYKAAEADHLRGRVTELQAEAVQLQERGLTARLTLVENAAHDAVRKLIEAEPEWLETKDFDDTWELSRALQNHYTVTAPSEKATALYEAQCRWNIARTLRSEFRYLNDTLGLALPERAEL